MVDLRSNPCGKEAFVNALVADVRCDHPFEEFVSVLRLDIEKYKRLGDKFRALI